MQGKNQLMSFLQVYGMLLVVMGHSFYACPDNPVKIWIYSFHMPLFMFLSGYLLRYGLERKSCPLSGMKLGGRQGFLMKKVRRLLVPYVVISSLSFFPKVALSRFALHPLEASWGDYVRMLAYPLCNVIVPFWFLPTLFLIFLVVAGGARLSKFCPFPVSHWLFVAVALGLHLFNPLTGVSVLNLGGVTYHLVYFLLGYSFCHDKVAERLAERPGRTAGAAFLVSLLWPFVPDFAGKDVCEAVNGILMSLCLGHLYVRRGWTFLHHLFGSSYAVYLFSWYPQTFVQQILFRLFPVPLPVCVLVTAVSGVYVPWMFYRWMMKNRERKAGKVVAFMAGH